LQEKKKRNSSVNVPCRADQPGGDRGIKTGTHGPTPIPRRRQRRASGRSVWIAYEHLKTMAAGAPAT